MYSRKKCMLICIFNYMNFDDEFNHLFICHLDASMHNDYIATKLFFKITL